jgi:hypothetical protein
MKRILSYLFILIPLFQMYSQTITQTGGWLECAFVKWTPVVGATSYNVYYTGGGVTNRQIDTQLIRSYGTYFRADLIGLTPGSYTVKVAPVINAVEGAGTISSPITVVAHDRNGFAFSGGRIPGGYNLDGTPKTGAVIIYITQNTKNSVSMNITGATVNPCVGFQNILYGIKKGRDPRPFIFRMIGNITDCNVLEGGDIVISLSVGLQDFRGGAQQGGALSVREFTQGGATLLACKGKCGRQVKPSGIHPDQFSAQHGVVQSRACTLACLPLSADEIGEAFCHGALSGWSQLNVVCALMSWRIWLLVMASNMNYYAYLKINTQ